MMIFKKLILLAAALGFAFGAGSWGCLTPSFAAEETVAPLRAPFGCLFGSGRTVQANGFGCFVTRGETR